MAIDTLPAWIAIAAMALVFTWLYYRGLPKKPHIRFSSLEGLTNQPLTWLQRLQVLPQGLLWTACLLLTAAFLNPHGYVAVLSAEGGKASPMLEKKGRQPPKKGTAIYLILDQSGSMEEKIPLSSGWGTSGEISKLDLMKKVAKDFIEKRPNDLIGMVTFARTAQVLSPLTLDHQTLLKILARLDIMRIKDQDGTGIGYAIYKTANIIVATRHFAEERAREGKPYYDIIATTIVLITDGLQDPNQLDAGSQWRAMGVVEAAKYAASNGIRVYVVNVDPALAEEKYALQRHEIAKAAQVTGGKFFQSQKAENLIAIFKEIESMEKTALPPDIEAENAARGGEKEVSPPMEVSYAKPFIILALACLTLAVLLDALWLRKIP